VSGVRIASQGRHIFDKPRPNRIKMNVSDEFEKVCVLLADDGLIAILKQMSYPPVSLVDLDIMLAYSYNNFWRLNETCGKKRLARSCQDDI